MAPRKILIVGGGIGGLTLAIALGRYGIRAEIAELRDTAFALGSGLAQPTNALRCLKGLGLLEACLAKGYQTDAYAYFDPDGSLLARRDGLRLAGADVLSYNIIFRPFLHEILTEAAKKVATIRYGLTVADLKKFEDGVDVTFSDGRTSRYDIVVGADGVRSSIRRFIFGGKYEPINTGQACWRALGPRPAELKYGAVYLGEGLRAGAVPLGENLMYLFLITNDADDRIPNEEMRTYLRTVLRDFGGFIPEILADLDDESDIVCTTIEEVLLPPPWHDGRVVLIGDASHACGPQIGQGGAMAVEDAVVLAELLAKNEPPAATFNDFVRRRYERCKFVQDWSRTVGDQNRVTDPQACRHRNAMIKKMALEPLRPHEVRLSEPI
jgi:2-polyprenyl-6-methoxyphenol hydroxylase-like FAD-dependent oxidoreductase